MSLPPRLTTRQTSCNVNINSSLLDQISKFWKIEEPPITRHLSAEEDACERHFVNTTTRAEDGRFVVELPLRSQPTTLGDSRNAALKRFRQLERKFTKDPYLHHNYSSDLAGYLQSGHMQSVPELDGDLLHQSTFYLPHHAVIQGDRPTTKLRVVFDGSAPSSTGVSLNDILMIGPTIQDPLIAIITRFRIHRHVITADIIKMYRQVRIHPKHTNLQRILWRESNEKSIQTYRLNTVTYGTASAPFLATRCLLQLARDEADNFPTTSHVISKDFYVDDLLTGADSREEVTVRKEEINQVLAKGGFKLHKWNSTCPELRDSPKPSDNLNDVSFTNGGTPKTLGLVWNPD